MTTYDNTFGQYGDSDSPLEINNRSFSPKEIALLELLSTTASQNKFLANVFNNDLPTIKFQLSVIYKKIRVKNRSGAILFWLANRSQFEAKIKDNKFLLIAREKLVNGFNSLSIQPDQIDHN